MAGVSFLFSRTKRSVRSSAASFERSLFIFIAALLCGNTIAVADAAGADCTNVHAAGWNRYGQFGIGDAYPIETTPVETYDEGGGLLDVAAGEDHTAIVQADGTAWTAGYNVRGQLGHNDTSSRWTFTRVDGLENVVRVIAGYENTFFIMANGEVFATGLNANGQLGLGDTINRLAPVKVLIDDVVDMAASATHTLFRTSDDTVYAAGWSGWGQLCIGYVPVNTDQTSPVQINTLSNVQQIAAGSSHSVLLTLAGEVWTCGRNDFGQLGLGVYDAERNAPTRVVNGLSSIVMKVAASWGSTSFLLVDGTVRSTGHNGDGQLGVGDIANRNAPVSVSIDGVADIFGSKDDQLFFRREDGSIWGTGDNEFGELGVGDRVDRNTPTEVVSLGEEGVSYVAGGKDFTFFIADTPCPSVAPSYSPAPSDTPSASPTAEIKATIFISLFGVPNAMMGSNDTGVFQDVFLEALKEDLVSQDVFITDVIVIDQDISTTGARALTFERVIDVEKAAASQGDSSLPRLLLVGSNRGRSLLSSSVLDVTTDIIGWYIPPPEKDLEDLAEDSINTNGDEILQDLQNASATDYFDPVTSVSARQLPSETPSSSPTNEPTTDTRSSAALWNVRVGKFSMAKLGVICAVLQGLLW